ncbi:OsmC family protein [Propionibacteriaceae bacterium Y2011]
MTNDQHRSVDLDRLERGRYRVTNPRGGELTIGDGSGDDFTPVELLLTAIAGCTAVDVDLLITKRAEPIRFRVRSTGEKLPDHRMADLEVIFDVEFGDDDAGRTAQDRLPEAIRTSHDRLCTVSRTVEQGVPVRSGVRGVSDV